jgi:hypothetical protein
LRWIINIRTELSIFKQNWFTLSRIISLWDESSILEKNYFSLSKIIDHQTEPLIFERWMIKLWTENNLVLKTYLPLYPQSIKYCSLTSTSLIFAPAFSMQVSMVEVPAKAAHEPQGLCDFTGLTKPANHSSTFNIWCYISFNLPLFSKLLPSNQT